MTERPRRLLWQSDVVVRASRELSADAKLAWAEIRGLDGGADGCYLGASALSDRLGRSPDAIERTRRALVAVGLLDTRLQPGRRTASWYPLLPGDAIPVIPSGVADPERWRPPPELVRRLADALDARIRALRGPRVPETGGADAAGCDARMAAPAPPVRADWRRGRGRTGGVDAAPTGGAHAGQPAARTPPAVSSSSSEAPLELKSECERVASAPQRRATRGLAALAPAEREALLAADPALRAATEKLAAKRAAADRTLESLRVLDAELDLEALDERGAALLARARPT